MTSDPAAFSTASTVLMGLRHELADAKDASQERLKRELGVTLRYPTYREGLRALFAGCAAGLNAMNTR